MTTKQILDFSDRRSPDHRDVASWKQNLDQTPVLRL